MRILDEQVETYIHGLRPERSPVMAEMEDVAERDSVPIVHWETGRLLAALCRALDPVALEVGTGSATPRCTWPSSSRTGGW
jgi:predicted O-methyltransferase YrrM